MGITTDAVLSDKMYVWTLKKFAHPKTSKYWADVVDWMVLINPEFIVNQLESAKQKVQNMKNEWWDILVISEKWVLRDEISQLCEWQWIHYMNYKVPAGVLTNFDTLKWRIDSMVDLSSFMESSEFASLTKKEKLSKKRKLMKLKLIYGWVRNLKQKPSLVIIVDGVFLSNFVDEAEKAWVDNIVISSTDFDRYWSDENLIVSNVNSYRSLKSIMEYILK